MFNINPEMMSIALTLMWQGMAGIFFVMICISLIVYLFTKFSK